MEKKSKKCQVKIPKLLKCEVDKIVEETGLYSDEVEFVTDAVRRLIIDNKKQEVNRISQRSGLQDNKNVKVENAKHKGVLNDSPEY